MITMPKGTILKCRHCQTPMYEVTEDIGFGRIELPDGGWKAATPLLSIHTVKPIEPQTIGDEFHDCVNCGQHDFGV